MRCICLLAVATPITLLGGDARILETVLPALAYGAGCSSGIEIRNLGERPAVLAVEAHRASGALAELEGAAGNSFRMRPGEKMRLRPRIEEETTGAWIEIRETVPVGLRPSAAVRALTECVDRAAVRTVERDAAYPLRNPRFEADAADFPDASILILNTTEQPVKAIPCYSAGNLYSMPGQALAPVCSSGSSMEVPPFGSKVLPLRHEGSSHFELRTRGNGIVLQVLRPIPGSARVFAVDSSVSFGEETSRP